jgi:molecular chaperone GrpE
MTQNVGGKRGPASDSTSAILTLVDSLQEELADAKEKFLRLAADFDNYKKRSSHENDRRASAQKGGFIRELLPVIDNLERASIVDPSASPEQLRVGVRMTLDQIRQLLSHHGIETEDTVGQTFDPHRHEALRTGYDPTQPDEVVLEVYQPGYYRGQEVLRPATVVVNDLSHPETAKSDRNGG